MNNTCLKNFESLTRTELLSYFFSFTVISEYSNINFQLCHIFVLAASVDCDGTSRWYNVLISSSNANRQISVPTVCTVASNTVYSLTQ